MHNIASPIVIKAGGSAMGASADAALARDVASLSAAGHAVVVVHGGGPQIDAELARVGISNERVDGLRTTSAAALEVIERVLCGTVNHALVGVLRGAGVPAIGISGLDGPVLLGRAIDPQRYGFVGEIDTVATVWLRKLLARGLVPVVAPLAYDPLAKTALNVNADTSAAAIAAALNAREFVLLTNVPRVRRDAADAQSGIDELPLSAARDFVASPACEGSMRPKIRAAIDAVAAGVAHARIGAAPIMKMLDGDATVVFA